MICALVIIRAFHDTAADQAAPGHPALEESDRHPQGRRSDHADLSQAHRKNLKREPSAVPVFLSLN